MMSTLKDEIHILICLYCYFCLLPATFGQGLVGVFGFNEFLIHPSSVEILL